MASVCAWMLAVDIDGSKILTWEPKSGLVALVVGVGAATAAPAVGITIASAAAPTRRRRPIRRRLPLARFGKDTRRPTFCSGLCDESVRERCGLPTVEP